MKTNRYLAVLLALGLSACGEKFIDLVPPSQISANTYFKTAADFNTGVMAAYGALQSSGQYQDQWILAELRTDNTIQLSNANSPATQIDEFTIASTNADLANAWRDHYQGIARCNLLIDRLAASSIPDAQKTQFGGEARFLRALMYFNLVRYFGDVPLVTKEVTDAQEGYQHGRVATKTVYEQIVRDLQEAEKSLPLSFTGVNLGRATRGAAQSLLVKVYLTMAGEPLRDAAKLPLARDKAAEVITAGTYGLLPNYADVFLPQNAYHRESIFEVGFKAGGFGEGSSWTTTFAPTGEYPRVVGIPSGAAFNLPTPDMVRAYAPGDPRFKASMDTGYVDTRGRYVRISFVRKYLSIPFAPGDADNNWPVLRYADLLLMQAEILNELGQTAQALPFVNQVRKRANQPDLAGLTQAQLRLAIERERQVELAFENHRWFDLVRTGRAVEVMNGHFSRSTLTDLNKIRLDPKRDLLYPIPQTQIDINPAGLPQNPGY